MIALRQALSLADAIVIGAGAGLSTAAGHQYAGERFEKNFSDFAEKYHFQDMYSGTFYPYGTLEEYWAYMSRHIYLNRYAENDSPVHQSLFSLVAKKNYFVITTNVDHLFQKAGFDKKRLFYTQGDYGLWQCSEPCHQKTYDNREAVLEMVKTQKDLKIPTNLIPHCPVCGKPMSMNLRCDNTFVEDEGWHAAAARYRAFLKNNKGKHVLFLELGVGNNTPVIIKYPFWQMTNQNKNATYACVNQDSAAVPDEITAQSICLQEDIVQVIHSLK